MNRSLGQILIGENMLSPQQVDEVVDYKTTHRCHFGDACVQLGFLNDEEVLTALGIQLYIPMVDLNYLNISEETLELINKEQAKEMKIMPLFVLGNTLTVATSDPMNIGLTDRLKKMSRKEVQTVLASEKMIKESFANNYSTGSAFMGGISDETIAGEEQDSEENIKIAENIMIEAVKTGSSDIHIEPGEEKLRVRFRKDGILEEVLALPPNKAMGLVSRFKIQAGIDIAESRKPQDGRFQQEVMAGKPVDVRVSTYPTPYGEKVVMRVLDQSKGITNLNKLGFSRKTMKIWEEVYHSGNGIVLVTGPTGSGKSTTLYATLSKVNSISENIMTIEDPIEYQLAGIVQGQVNEKAGMTFAAALRSMLRQDPDIIMVGEMRDNETIELAVRAALTGHLVFSTIHTNDAASTYTRLTDMGTDPFLLTTTIRGILAQRLIRRLCEKCKIKHKATEVELDTIGMAEYAGNLYQAAAQGCDNCNNGYSGRAGLYELLVPTEEINEIVKVGGNSLDINKLAIKQGMATLLDAAHDFVKKGSTSIEEISRVI
jgi:type IV pilus assembly protein PilB